jgi:competence protein ComEC
VKGPYTLLGSLCVGLAAANLARPAAVVLAALALAAAAFAVADPDARLPALACALALAGWCWGAARLELLDRSALLPAVGTAERALVDVTAPPRIGHFGIRVPARVLRFGRLEPHEPVLLELPLGRSPPLGGRLEVLGQLALPRGPSHGFDERTWLRRHGVHVVLRGDRWRLVGRRGGLAGVADTLHRRLARVVGRGLHGERRGVVEGVVLGEDQGLSDSLRQSFRASGLYHLLAVSGQNVVLVAGGALILVWLLGLPRVAGHLAALLAMAAYVLAVGPQPSVIRAGVAGALGSLAWLAARTRDRWYALLLGAFALLAWNPYTLLDAGFQLSFAAVLAIFTLAPRLRRWLDGYPIPGRLADVVALSTACGLATAPISWLQFHAVPLLTVPANALAAPAVVPLLGLAFATAGLSAIAPPAAALAAQANGWCAAYLASCARLVAAVPGAQIRSGRAAAAVLGVVLLAAAYAWRRGQRAEAGLPAHRQRPPEDRARAAPAAGPDR